jgi:hypothetical protein
MRLLLARTALNLRNSLRTLRRSPSFVAVVHAPAARAAHADPIVALRDE